MDRLPERIRVLVPLVDFEVTCILQDNSDGLGPYIRYWNAAALGRPQPTDAELLAVVLGPYGPRRPRLCEDVVNDLKALTTVQKNAVWANITSGTPPKWSTNKGPSAPSFDVLHMIVVSPTSTGAQVLDAKLHGAAMYCKDNPGYLVHPAFDQSINVPGDEVIL